MSWRGILYRLGQFLNSVRALMAPPNENEAHRLLTPAEQVLFRRMARYDRAHALRVLHQLQQQGIDQAILLRAALLHDVGKMADGERIPLLYRGLIVIARRLPPRLWAWLVQERPAGHPLRPFYLHTTHAVRGAALVREAGGSEALVEIIASHHDKGVGGLIRLLQEADRRS